MYSKCQKEVINLAQKKGGGEILWRNLDMLKSVGIDKERRWKIKQERLSFGGNEPGGECNTI